MNLPDYGEGCTEWMAEKLNAFAEKNAKRIKTIEIKQWIN